MAAALRKQKSLYRRGRNRLVDVAEKHNPGAIARGETMLSFTTKINDTEVTMTGINTVLPTKKTEHDENIVVMRKSLM